MTESNRPRFKMNLPNQLTILRMLVVPVFVASFFLAKRIDWGITLRRASSSLRT
jgi:phosphatidylglycerophosphate synthase